MIKRPKRGPKASLPHLSRSQRALYTELDHCVLIFVIDDSTSRLCNRGCHGLKEPPHLEQRGVGAAHEIDAGYVTQSRLHTSLKSISKHISQYYDI
jgi:hypothetical protein